MEGTGFDATLKSPVRRFSAHMHEGFMECGGTGEKGARHRFCQTRQQERFLLLPLPPKAASARRTPYFFMHTRWAVLTSRFFILTLLDACAYLEKRK
jgi:hypothetical protein